MAGPLARDTNLAIDAGGNDVAGLDEGFVILIRFEFSNGIFNEFIDIYPDSSETRKKLWQSGR